MFKSSASNKLRRCLLMILVLFTSNSSAYQLFEAFQLHGFANQGYFIRKSSRNNGSLGFTEIGINLSAQPLNQISFAFQGIYRKAGEVSDETQIDFALMDWTLYNSGQTQFGIRVGRVKNPIGFYNETRDIAFTRPSIILPQGIYYERLRDLFLSTDGVQLYLNQLTHIGEFTFQLNLGEPTDSDLELKTAFLGFEAPGFLEPQSTYLGKLEYESTSGATRLAISYVNLDLKYQPSKQDILSGGDFSSKLLILSAQHHVNKFTITGEYLLQKNTFTNLEPIFPDYSPTSESYYLQGDYNLTHKIQANLRYGISYFDSDDKKGLLSSIATNKPAHSRYSNAKVAGLRWAPNNNWMLRAEYHRIHGTSSLSHADNPFGFLTTKKWDLFALQLSYRF